MKITSIQTKLLLFLLPIFILSFGVLSGVSYYLSLHSLAASVDETAMSIGTDYANRVRADIDEKMAHLEELAATKRVQSGDRDQIVDSMAETYQRLGMFDAIIYIAPDGLGIRWNRSTSQYADREYFKKVFETKKSYVSNPLISNSTGKISFMLVVPILHSGQVTGIIAATYTLDRLTEMIRGLTFKETGYGSIVDNSGLLLAHPKMSELEGKLNYSEKKINPELKLKQTELDDREIALFSRVVESRNAARGTYTFVDGVDQLATYTPIKLPGGQQWVMIVAAPESEATRATTTMARMILGVSLIFIILVVIFVVIISKRFASPISLIRDECLLLTQGDLRDRVDKVNSQDEIGQLSLGFRAMRSNLCTLVTQIQSHAEQVTASAEELTASSHQSAQASNQVAGSITDIASSMAQQIMAVNETTNVVETMSVSIEEVTASANLAADKSALAAETAKEGSKSVEQAVNQMAQIEQATTTSAQVVTTLGERSKEIGQIVSTISGIADQTNLLALNAAIEAARAGEQGRGFAVVADEVRKLAEQSQAAAKQIAELINEIQTDTNKAVVAMNEGSQQVQIGTEVVSAAGHSFRQISEIVMELSGQVNGISTAIQQMANDSEYIVSSVRKIDGLSQNTAAETQTVSASTKEQSASLQEIASASQNLAKMAEELQQTIRNFQI